MAEGRDESRGHCLDRGGSQDIGARTNQTGILRRSSGCLTELTIMESRGSICQMGISISYGTQPIRSILLIIPTLLLVTIMAFMLVRFIPGDVLDMMIAEWSTEAGVELEDVEALRRALGLDASLPVRYGRWLGVCPQETGEFSGLFKGNRRNPCGMPN